LNLMEQERYSLKRICYDSGFRNYQQFIRRMQHIFNRSPKEMRGMVQDFGAKQIWEQFGILTKSLKI
jgi:AraC-like DNA-binding protein